jgi:ABC-type phosphate transport system permease subunit
VKNGFYRGTRSSNGVKPLILWVFGAIILALPVLAAAIYLSEIAKKRTRNLLRPLIELLAEFHLLFMVFWIGGYRALNSKSFTCW